jgi:membrane protease YdiL (CAAX protease family)
MIPAANSQFNQLKVRNLIVAYLLIHVGVGFILGIFGSTSLIKNPSFPLIMYVMGIIPTCLWVVHRCDRLQISVDGIVGDRPKQMRWLKLIGLTIAVTSFSMGSALVMFSLLQTFFPDFVKNLIESSRINAQQGTSLITYIWNFIALVVVAPVAEEFLFRGIILNRWRERWGAPRALIFSSLFFGFLHPHPIGLSMFGLVMGLLYFRDKTLWTPIFCHALNNLFAFISIVLSGYNPDRSDPASDLLPNLVGGALISAIALGFLGRFIARNFPNNQKSG